MGPTHSGPKYATDARPYTTFIRRGPVSARSEDEYCPFSTSCKATLGPTQPPIRWVLHTAVPSMPQMQGHTLPSSAEGLFLHGLGTSTVPSRLRARRLWDPPSRLSNGSHGFLWHATYKKYSYLRNRPIGVFPMRYEHNLHIKSKATPVTSP
jgi:hypothetical protein